MRIFAGVLLAGLASGVGAAPFDLDWDTQTWTPEGNGNLSESLPVGNHNVVVTFTGNTAELDQDDGGDGSSPIAPAINSQNTGGLSPVQDGLYIGTDYTDQSNPTVTVSFDFSQYPAGISGISFTIFDVDASGSFIDRFIVTALNGGGPINPTSRTTSTANTLFGANGIEGTSPAGGTTSDGNATFAFSQSGITQITVVYSNEIGLANPGFQFVNIHDMSFDAQVADIEVQKSVDDLTPVIGSNVTFTLTALNNGPDTAPSVEVTDLLPAGYSYVSDTGGGNYNSVSGVWTVGSLANAASDSINIVATVNATGPYANTASVTDVGVDDTVPGNDTATVTPVPALQADLSLTKIADNTEPAVGATVVFTITVANAGPNDATGVVVQDLLPAGFAYVSDTPSQGGYISGTGNWAIGTIANGANATLAITATVQATGSYTNTAEIVAANETDPDSTPGNGILTEDDQQAVTITPAQIGMAKRVSAGPVSNGDGSFNLSYILLLENTGSVALNNVQATDSLVTSFAGSVFSLVSVSSADFLVNFAFDGDGNTNLLAGTDNLAIGATGTIALTISVTPGANLGPYNNTADVSAASTGGTPVSDTSTDGTNVDPDGDGDPGNNFVPTPVSFVESPEIGLAKSAGPVINNGDGSYTFAYTVTIENTGDVLLFGVQASDDLAGTFAGAGISVGAPVSTDFAVNAGFDGDTDTDLLAGTDSLAPGVSGTVDISITVTPGAGLGPYNNTANGTGTSPGGTGVTDVSTDGSNVDPDGSGGPGNNSTPTPVTFAETPELGAAKTITSGPVNNGDGSYALTYSIRIENTGDVSLSALQVTDDLATTFAGAGVSGVILASGDFTINPGYNGIADTNLLTGVNSLVVTQSGTISVSLTVTPGANLGPYDNIATAGADSPSGASVSDVSTDGTDVDPDGSGGPGNNSTPTPVTFAQTPQIGAAKAVSAGPVNNNDGSYSLSYTIVVENTGDVDLAGLRVVDDLATTFGATPFSIDSVNSAVFATNPAYNGSGDTELLDGSDTLTVASSGTVTVALTVTPGANLGPYDNVATAFGTSPAAVTVSDVSTSGSDVDPDGIGGPGNNADPTPVSFTETARIGLAKELLAAPVSNGDGSFSFSYRLRIENFGDVPLNAVQIGDDLAVTFAGVTSFAVDDISSGDLAANAGFDGTTDQNILLGTDSLAVGATGSVDIAMTVTPGASLGPFNNTATASGISLSGATANDNSTDGSLADPDSDGDPGNNSTPTQVSFVEAPQIGVAKAITTAPLNDGSGNFTLTYTIVIANTGDVNLVALQAVDDLSTSFAGASAFSVDSVTSTDFTTNPAYDGSVNANLLAGTDTLAAGASGTLELTVTVTPGGMPGPYNNVATGAADSPAGATVTDDSQAGADVDPDSDGDPGNNNDPTPVTFGEAPQIGAAKTVSAGPVSNGDGTFTLTWRITIANTGDVVLSAVQVSEDLDTTLAAAVSYSVDSVVSADLATNGAFDGSADTAVLAGTDTLAVGASATVDIVVTVTPGANLGPYNNTAIAQGTSPGLTPVSDVSTDGTDVDPDGVGGPGNNADPTTVSFVESPQIGLAKALTGAPLNNGDGSYALTYSIRVENTGDVDLDSLQVSDDLAMTFAAATSFTLDSVASADFAVDPVFDGDSNQNLLLGGDTLTAGGVGTIDVMVTVTPATILGPYNNTANVTANSPSGAAVADVSTDGADVDPDGTGGPGNNSAPTPVTFVETPQIGLAKAVTGPPASNSDGSATLTYTLFVENTGDVPVGAVQIADDLSLTFAAANGFSVVGISSADLSINPLYNGITNLNLLIGNDSLAPGAGGSLSIVVTVNPGANLGPYDNTARASAASPSGAPVSDDSTDGADVDPDGSGGPGNNSVPTPVMFSEMPSIGVAKTLLTGPVANGDGSFTLAYRFGIENAGDVALANVQISDDLAVTFAGAVAFAVDGVVSSTLSANGGYDGFINTNLVSGLDTLAIGASASVDVMVTVTPGANLGPYDNVATATGMSPSATPASDDSVDGTVPDLDGDGDPGNDASPTPVTFVETPQIALAKSVSAAPASNGDGTFTLIYTLTLDNSGTVPLLGLQVSDNLAATFAGVVSFSVDAVTSGDFAVNPFYNGGSATALLAGSDTLAPGATGTIALTVTVDPGGMPGPYDNTATAIGTSPAGTGVSDVSQSGVNPDPDGDGNPANNSDPTPVSFDEAPQIGAAKQATAAPVSNGDGTFGIVYNIVVENSGEVALDAVQIVENLDVTFAAAAGFTVDSVTSGDLAVNPGFDGSGDTNLLAGSDTLAVGATGNVALAITVTPGVSLGPYGNTATAAGTSPGGTPVSDDSQDGAAPDPDADGNPGNNSDPTHVTFSESPAIGLAKQVSAGPLSNGDGTYTLTLTLLAENTGDAVLTNIQIVDNLATSFATADAFVVDAVTSTVFAPNPAYDGGVDSDLLLGADSLTPDASGTVEVTLSVTPGGNLGPYSNTASVAATSAGGGAVGDDSQDGADVDPDGDGNPGNNADPTSILFVENPAIGAAKRLASAPVANGDGSFTLSYVLLVANTGDVALVGLNVSDDLAATFAGATAFAVDAVSSSTLTTNPGFDGVADTSLLSGADTLATGATALIDLTVTVTPGAQLGPYDNSAQATGASPGGTGVSDASQDGVSIDPDGDGDAGDNAEPTSVTFMEMPILGLAKSVSTGPVSNGDGSFDLTYRLIVRNSGDVDVMNLQMTDDLNSVFAGATSIVVNSLSSAQFATNAAFDGVADTNLLSGGDTLTAGASASIEIALTVDPGVSSGPYNNSASISAVSSGGMPVTDLSQSGVNPDPDGNGNPGDNSDPTPVSFSEMPVLGAAKLVTAGPINNGDGSFTLSYLVTIVNSGNVPLSVVQITEDLNTTFAGASSIVVDSVSSSDFAPNPNFDGVSDTNLLGGADLLAAGATRTAQLTVTVATGGSTGPFDNSVIASGETPGGTPVSDVSTEGTDPDPEGDGPGDNMSSTSVMFVEAAALGVAKRITGPPVNNGDGTFSFGYEIIAGNSGDTPLNALQLRDSLATTFATAVSITVDSLSSADFTVNAGFDGDADDALLTGADTLAPGVTGTLTLTLTLSPGGSTGPFDNSVTADAVTPGGIPISDISTDGADIDPDGDGDPGNNSVPTPLGFPGAVATLAGNAWLDANIDDVFDPGEAPLTSWIIEVTQAGTVIGSAAVAADGSYRVDDLPPGNDYTVLLRNPANNAVFGIIAGVTLPPGTTIVDQNLPIDPSGVVYDSDSRLPVVGAQVSLSGTTGVLPVVCLLPGQQDQVTGPLGFYRFDVNVGADPACPPGGTYTISVIAPTGFLDPPSGVLPPLAGPFSPTGQASPFAVAPQPGAPQAGDATDYYLSFVLTNGDPDVINNHIPLDPPAGNVDIRLSKTAGRRQGSIGDLIPYSLSLENVGVFAVRDLVISDAIPAGFSYVEGSARLLGDGTLTVSGQRPVAFAGIDLPVGETATVRYMLRVGAGVVPGDYVNAATPLVAGVVVGNTATATVAIVADPDFEQTTIVGKVFHDRNGDGLQDASEPGIPGVRLATVEGLLIETDASGRYHLAGVDGGFFERGRNFIIKVDPASLPDGARFTNPNPRVKRITQGLMNRFDFGVRLPPEMSQLRRIAVKMGEVFFAPGSAQIRPEFEPLLDDLAGRLRRHGGGRLIFAGSDSCVAASDEVTTDSYESINYTLTPRFAVRKTELRDEDREELARIASEWAGARDLTIVAWGHTSDVRIAPQHRNEYRDNYALSEARARSVAGYLLRALELADSQMVVHGLGPDQPVASNATPAGRANNRRVELRITGARDKPVFVTSRSGQCNRDLALQRARNVYAQIQRRLGNCSVCDIEIVVGGKEIDPMQNNPDPNPGP